MTLTLGNRFLEFLPVPIKFSDCRSTLFVCPMLNDEDIGLTEAALIAKENPDWNIQLKTYPI